MSRYSYFLIYEQHPEFLAVRPNPPFSRYLKGDYDFLLNHCDELDPELGNLANKIDQTCQKLLQMYYGGLFAFEVEREFQTKHNSDMLDGSLFGKDKILILYHFESLIFHARSALDCASTVFSEFFFSKREDSFTAFCRLVENSKEPEIIKIQKFLESSLQKPSNWLTSLSSRHSGRSLRDKISHQMSAPIYYREYKEGSERESCHIWF